VTGVTVWSLKSNQKERWPQPCLRTKFYSRRHLAQQAFTAVAAVTACPFSTHAYW